MTFWLAALAIGAFVALVLVLVMVRARDAAAPAAEYDLQVYRDQLAAVERDLARGVIDTDEAARLRIDLGRRVLEADRALQAAVSGASSPRRATQIAALVVGAAVLGGAGLIYSRLGAPGYDDLPLKARIAAAEATRLTRPDQTRAEAETPPAALPAPDPRLTNLVAQLRAVMQQRPDDPKGLILLARNEAALGNFKAAYQAQARLIELQGDSATAADYSTLGEFMVLAAGGYVSPQAEAALEKALARDAADPSARYYLGLMHAQTGRPDIAFDLWRKLLEQSPPDAPWLPSVRAGLPELAFLAGSDYELPPLEAPALRGPGADDVKAAGEMTDDQRQDMIRGMVDRLSDRLATEGGTPDEWAQLLRALGVLGETDRAAAIWAEAQQVFAAQPQGLDVIRPAAQSAGVTP